NRGRDDSHQLHRGIEPTPCNDQGVAFTDGDHPETHNYRPACARPSLAAPRRSSLVVQKSYRVAVGVANDWRGRAMTKTVESHEHQDGGVDGRNERAATPRTA